MKPTVIVGSGLAGYTLAKELRKLDRRAPLVLLSADDACFYSKPMLSNAFASGKAPADIPMASAGDMARQLDARIFAGVRVSRVVPEQHRIALDGETIEYAKLVLAVGADPIRLSLRAGGADAPLSVNDLSDYARFRGALASAKRIAIMGAGLIGCEFANDLAGAGFEVAVIDPAAWPLGRLLPETAGRALQAALADAGVDWRLGSSATGIQVDGSGYRLALSGGVELHADVVLSAVGLKPRTVLAQEAGIRIGRGVMTDRFLRTSAPDVFALGDCAEVQGLNLPYVQPIMYGARALARTLGGTPTPVAYPAMPVVVKTPALPAVVAPPPAGARGEWRIEAAGTSIRAVFVSPSGSMLGFALTGEATAERQKLARVLPPVWSESEVAEAAA